MNWITWEEAVDNGLQQIRKQRDILLRGTWTQGNPHLFNSGCQIHYLELDEDGYSLQGSITNQPALRAIHWAQAEQFSPVLSSHHPSSALHVMNVNDLLYSSGQDAIDVLDRAEIILKECLDV